MTDIIKRIEVMLEQTEQKKTGIVPMHPKVRNLRVLLFEAKQEIERLNKWADDFSNAQLKERATGEAYQQELKQEIERLRVKEGYVINPDFTKYIEDYVDGYVLRGDEGNYTPIEKERYLIVDCILGLIDDKEFIAMIQAAEGNG